MAEKKYDLVIIGAGPAGLSAAIYGRRAGLTVLVLDKDGHGGQIKLTSLIENWPGTSKTSGYDLAESFLAHARETGAEFLNAHVTSISASPRVLHTSEGDIKAGAIIVASGASFRRLGVTGEVEFEGRGVSYCAVCDGPFFRNQDVAVIGGGNTAVEEAMYLTNFVSKVYLIHRRESFRADQYLVDKAKNNDKIKTLLNSTVSYVLGDRNGVNKIIVRDVISNQETELEVHGVFIFVGTVPHTAFLNGMLETDEGGAIITDADMATSLPGFFAAGDVRNTGLRQVVTAAADGARAAMSAYQFLATNTQ